MNSIPLLTLTLAAWLTTPTFAADPTHLATGQTLYVPAYSHIYTGDHAKPLLLAVTLSIRNIDPLHSLTVTEVGYYDTAGTLVKTYLDAPLTLAPLASTRYVVAERDEKGGSGANFMVKWESATPLNPPITETIMISTQSQLGISFTSRGQPIHPTP